MSFATPAMVSGGARSTRSPLYEELIDLLEEAELDLDVRVDEEWSKP